jgi:hypothetical protein
VRQEGGGTSKVVWAIPSTEKMAIIPMCLVLCKGLWKLMSETAHDPETKV